MAQRKDAHPRAVKRKNRQIPADPELSGYVVLPEQIGKGSYSNIYKARSLAEPDLQIAVKVSAKSGQRARTNFNSAVFSLRRLQHPNIIRLYHAQETSQYFYEIMEHVQRPSTTLTAILTKPEYKFTGDMIAPVAAQLISALAHMHAQRVGHRDIKPDNILVNPHSLQVTIIDFGFATSTLELCNDFCGSPIFAAPEVLSFQPFQVDLADLWSLGVVIYTMCFGDYPFPAQDIQELTLKVTRQPLQFPANIASAAVRQMQPFVTALLQKVPTQRASAASLLTCFAPLLDSQRTQFTPNTELDEDAMELVTG